MPKTNDPIQAQLIAARRSQILDAAVKVFSEKGFHPTTVKDISREAGIADGTIYNYFKNKNDLLIGIFDRMRDFVVQAADLPALTDLDLRGFLKTYIQYPLMALKTDNFELFRVVMSEMMVNPELREQYAQKILNPTIAMAENYMQQWAEKQGVKPADLSLTIRLISSMMMGLMLEYIIGDETLQANWEELPDFLAKLISDGLEKNLHQP